MLYRYDSYLEPVFVKLIYGKDHYLTRRISASNAVQIAGMKSFSADE
jgi:hypothetical protein